MAWMEPKIDWSPQDGVRDTDFNRIEGNILDLYNTTKVNNDIELYVSPTGDDSIGDGSSALPYLTITKALSVIPKNLNGHNVLIYVATGTYNERVVVKGYSNGKITLAGYYGYVATLLSLEVDSSICEIRTLELIITSGGVTVINGATLISSGAITVSGSMRGLYVLGCSSCRIYANLTVRASSAAAVQVSGASMVYVLQLSGSDNENAILAEEGSIASYGSTNISVNVAGYITRTGGRILTGGGA